MDMYFKPLKAFITCLGTCLLVLVIDSCAPSVPSTKLLPVIQTVEVTQVATNIVPYEVTRLVEYPVTITPSPTLVQTLTPSLTPTITQIPSITPTTAPPRITILVTSACLYGPGSAYLYKYGLNATVWMTVIGRNMDGSWLNIKSANDSVWNACWIKATLVKFDTGSIQDVPVIWTGLPHSIIYPPPSSVSANRVGNVVTIFWQPVQMTQDKYRGYLIEAWICQGGTLVYLPIGYAPPYDQNNSMMAVQVTDEPGCDIPSSARIYSVEKHGYTDYRVIPWPGFDSTVTITPTQTPTP
ncbi:MAG: hypothetical protein WCE68_19015 [Anaerolineales bacterium]